ncbi:polyubiquitin-tagged protein recognition complex Npl4 component [Clavulina sp. PMI_390]|nr:polyubiquitin-tagged protein recognition complex Npl4 component [Clavulina sp. PMI_390]
MLVRVRSKDGNFRFELNPSDDASVLLDKILETAPNGDPNSVTVSQQPRGGETILKTLAGRSLQSLGLKHADLLFVGYKESAEQPIEPEPSTSQPAEPSPSAATTSSKRIWETVAEEFVDTYWRSKDGKIPRQRNPLFCRHSMNGMCDYCMPLEPYDAAYQAEHSIKHLSFHAYLRQLAPQQSAPSTSTTAASVGASGTKATPSSSLPPLNPLSYRVKNPCPIGGHAPYPNGICSSCQPSAITLARQTWRATDHVEIASPAIIDTFLSSWRHTGRQRFGWMLGQWKPYDEVPMGVKAVVEAIHEPAQEGDLDGLSLELPWEDEERVYKLAKDAGLSVVGMIFTDLTPDPEDKSKTLCKRHGDSFFLSSLEAIFAASQQLKHPLKTRSSPTGEFSSRLVTAVMSGTPEGGIDLACYATSEQGCAMVDADMIEATVEPGTVRIKTETEGEGRYVPDAFFTYKNEYGIQVKETAKPCFPVEYLLVNVTHGFPTNPTPLFRSPTPFAVENRPLIEPQNATQIFSALAALGAPKLGRSASGKSAADVRAGVAHYLSDWHLLAFLPNVGVLSEDDIKTVARIATVPDLNDPSILDPLLASDGWQTLMAITEESSPSRPSKPAPGSSSASSSRPTTSAPGAPTGGADDFEIPQEVYDQIAADNAASGGSGGGVVVCPHCTYENTAGATDCDVCGLPL